MERIKTVKINKQQLFLNTATPLINGVAGDSGDIVLGFCICIVPAVPWVWFCVKNGGDYSGAVQNTAALSDIAEVLFFILFLHCGALSKDSQDEQPKPAILYK